MSGSDHLVWTATCISALSRDYTLLSQEPVISEEETMNWCKAETFEECKSSYFGRKHESLFLRTTTIHIQKLSTTFPSTSSFSRLKSEPSPY